MNREGSREGKLWKDTPKGNTSNQFRIYERDGADRGRERRRGVRI
jgi:hypothetical protein